MKPAPDVVLADIAKNAREIIRVQLRTYKETRNVDVRVFFVTDDGYSPTGKGVSIKPAKLRDVIAALQEAEVRAHEEGLL